MSTSSRAAIFEPATGDLSGSIPTSGMRRFTGIFDDEADGRLYLVSSAAEIWEYEHATGSMTLRFQIPDDLVRRPNVESVPARIVALPGPGRFVLVMEEVTAVVEYDQGATRLFTGDRRGFGFSAITTVEAGEIMAIESAFGHVDLFDGVVWTSAGQTPTPSRVNGLAPLGTRRWLFVTVRGIAGVLDLAELGGCPEAPLFVWDIARALLRVGDEFYVAIQESHRGEGWGRLDLVSELL